jgi:pyruvate dehydrogenase E2 component (dihydrolipoamide acetyltransferase)
LTTKKIPLPDIGGATAKVIEIAVKPGDVIKKEDTLITLESDKASMEIPAPEAGTVVDVHVKLGDALSMGDVILTLDVVASAEKSPAQKPAEVKSETASKIPPSALSGTFPRVGEGVLPSPHQAAGGAVHAGPAVRRLAREFGVDLTRVRGTGPKNRILKEDVQNFVKAALAGGASGGAGLPQAPVVDFAKFGDVEIKPLSRIKKLTGVNLSRNWLLVPHVTQFDEADITEMEAFRKAQQQLPEWKDLKLTPLVFLMKAVVSALKEFPTFNASLDASGENLVLKKYFHIGVAVDTPEGLVVPVIRDVDQKTLPMLAKELADISAKARTKGLSPQEMQGSCFTISSLGGIGGTAFTPIVNLPDVAILGVSKSAMKPVYQDGQFVPRLMLPLSLSYDHRVIDGAAGARFTVHLAACLRDVKKLV